MKTAQMDISKRNGEGEKTSKVGEVTIFYPLLSELGLNAEPTKFDEEGYPVYETEQVQYVFDAVLSQVKAQARNKLQSGTAILKDGNKIAETIEELLAAGERGGEALKIRREFLDSFKKFLTASGKSAPYQAAVYDLVSTPKVISLQTEDRKAKISAMLVQYATGLTQEQAGRFAKNLLNIEEACKAINALDAE